MCSSTELINMFYLMQISLVAWKNSIIGFRGFFFGGEGNVNLSCTPKLSWTTLSWSINSCAYNSAVNWVFGVLVAIKINLGFTQRIKCESSAWVFLVERPLQGESRQEQLEWLSCTAQFFHCMEGWVYEWVFAWKLTELGYCMMRNG